MFGHIKGSFTSAHKDRTGKFEAANNGTIFLDEIGDMSMSAQSKVLRAIQENKIQIQSSPTDVKMEGLDTLSHNDVKDLLDSLSAFEIMPIGTMN